ncbi:MAG TPA: hypothetical protein VIG72_09580 [Pontibacter sp.]
MILNRALISETLTSDSSFYTIRYSEPLNLIEIHWEVVTSPEEAQQSLTHLLKLIEEREPWYLLADTRKLNSLGTEDQTWIRNSFLPALSQSSVVKFARIMEPDVFTQAVLESLLGYMQFEQHFGCSLRSFTDRESALDWIYSA